MTPEEAYAEGFCKTAEEFGIEPEALMKFAQEVATAQPAAESPRPITSWLKNKLGTLKNNLRRNPAGVGTTLGEGLGKAINNQNSRFTNNIARVGQFYTGLTNGLGRIAPQPIDPEIVREFQRFLDDAGENVAEDIGNRLIAPSSNR